MLFLWIYSAGCIAALLRTIIGLIIEYKVRQRNKERYEFDSDITPLVSYRHNINFKINFQFVSLFIIH